MKTISDYTIYCTSEQTKKALELGAPIAINAITNEPMCIYIAEQMINWLEDGLFEEIRVEQNIDGLWEYIVYGEDNEDLFGISNLYPSRKEATLAAIDAALEYLRKNDLIK